MDRFLSPLKVELQKDRKTWKVLETFSYIDPQAGVIEVPEGFVTDFSSVPRLPLTYALLGSYGHAAATIHDYLYDTHRVDRKTADRVFLNALRSSGIARWRAWLMYGGVRLFGASHYKG